MISFRLAFVAALVAFGLAVPPAAAQDVGYRVHTKKGAYATVREDLKDAIINRGFVIDYEGHFNKMLERTAEAAGRATATGTPSPYANAEYLQVCPSKLTHEAVSATPFGIANCPISVFVYELRAEPGKIVVGYRLPVGSPSKRVKEVNKKLVDLLEGIAKEATK
ncbi:MAG: hypothetical protein SFW09_21065 [Hyphomicrobiaceae bacterium]|nr:hypothetical protein [Hyphomicrobiaceae bacterium]